MAISRGQHLYQHRPHDVLAQQAGKPRSPATKDLTICHEIERIHAVQVKAQAKKPAAKAMPAAKVPAGSGRIIAPPPAPELSISGARCTSSSAYSHSCVPFFIRPLLFSH